MLPNVPQAAGGGEYAPGTRQITGITGKAERRVLLWPRAAERGLGDRRTCPVAEADGSTGTRCKRAPGSSGPSHTRARVGARWGDHLDPRTPERGLGEDPLAAPALVRGITRVSFISENITESRLLKKKASINKE